MKKDNYRVFVDNVHEYNMEVRETDDGFDEFSLVRTGSTWSEKHNNTVNLKWTDDGNGFSCNKIGKRIDYLDMLELSVMTSFINWYQTVNGSKNIVVSIEANNQVVKFII